MGILFWDCFLDAFKTNRSYLASNLGTAYMGCVNLNYSEGFVVDFGNFPNLFRSSPERTDGERGEMATSNKIIN